LQSLLQAKAAIKKKIAKKMSRQIVSVRWNTILFAGATIKRIPMPAPLSATELPTM
jgi:hypothetical protein